MSESNCMNCKHADILGHRNVSGVCRTCIPPVSQFEPAKASDICIREFNWEAENHMLYKEFRGEV